MDIGGSVDVPEVPAEPAGPPGPVFDDGPGDPADDRPADDRPADDAPPEGQQPLPTPAPAPDRCSPGEVRRDPAPVRPCAVIPAPSPPADDPGQDAGIPPVTVSDLARFTPRPPQVTLEPDGVAIVGAPFNPTATAAAHATAGELFGHPVTVRFSPVSFAFDYGDGTTATFDSGGATWTELGQEQLTPAPTSHVYPDRGSYPVTVAVHYAATADFGPYGSQDVPGTVVATAPARTVQVLRADRVLVDQTCAENPTGPGC